MYLIIASLRSAVQARSMRRHFIRQ